MSAMARVITLRVMVNIYLVGFMGAGKTSVGEALAGRLGARFLDLDDLLRQRFGCPIAEVFDTHGEGVFRAAETEELLRVARQEGLVVATGGGAFSSEANRKSISDSGGISVFLDPPWEIVQRRLEEDNAGRPMYAGSGQARSLYDERMPHYRRATVTVSLAGHETPAEVADTIADAVREATCAT